MGPSTVENVVDLACRTALTYHGVAHVTIPVDVQEMKADKLRSKRNVPHHSSDVAARSARLPADEDLRRAAEHLNAGRKVAILAGRGAPGAGTSWSAWPSCWGRRSSRRCPATRSCRATA